MKTKKLSNGGKITAGLLIASLTLIGFSNSSTQAQSNDECWDPIYHPGVTQLCECDSVNEDPCYSPEAIDKAGWMECPPPGSLGHTYEGTCVVVEDAPIGHRHSCAGDINLGGVIACETSAAAVYGGALGIVLPTGALQVASFIGSVLGLVGVIVACQYCNMVDCEQSSPTSHILRDVMETEDPEPVDCEFEGTGG